MSRYSLTRGEAIDLQYWALKYSGTGKYLEKLPQLPKKGKIKPGLYVSYELDESEFDDGLDWPTPCVATVYAVIKEDKDPRFLGEVTAYNFETFWLTTNEFDQVDTAENWWEIIKEEFEKIKK